MPHRVPACAITGRCILVFIALTAPCIGPAALGRLIVVASAPLVKVPLDAVRADDLVSALTLAKPGDTIRLPAGVFSAGIVLPAGVSLEGAGFGKTILDAKNAINGLTIRGGEGIVVADLSIIAAKETGLLFDGVKGATVRRIRVSGSLNGILFQDVAGGRIENTICDRNRVGIAMTRGSDNVVVNCTLAQNSSLGISLASGDRPRAFNNCVAAGESGILVGDRVVDPKVDHNLYDTRIVGLMTGQVGRKSLTDWRSLSGQDARSVQLAVTFRDNDRGDFHPEGTLDWALDRVATSDWGVSALAGVDAPTRDIEGNPRIGLTDVGAFESSTTAPRPPDGTISFKSDASLKSAGLFDPSGRLVQYLFHNLPLGKGPYPFWFPAKTFEGKPVVAGTYELRSAESDLKWNYLGFVGDSGEPYPRSRTAGVNPYHVAFDDENRLILGHGWSEDSTNLRGYDATSGRLLWTTPGSADLFGTAIMGESAYFIKPEGEKGRINRVDARSGRVSATKGWPGGAWYFDGGAKSNGLAIVDGRMFVSDLAANRVRFGTLEPPILDRQFEIAAPRSIAADPETKRVWLISSDKFVVALDTDGKVLASSEPVVEPAALAVRNGRLAVAYRATGKVHIFDARDPKDLKPIATVGTGDGPFGPVLPDRFHFQKAPGNPGTYVNLALANDGSLAVTGPGRLLVFDPMGKCRWSTFGLFGGAMTRSFADRQILFDREGRYSLRLDEAKRTWVPDVYWDFPQDSPILGEIVDPERKTRFGLHLLRDARVGDADLLITKLDAGRAVPVMKITRDPKSARYLLVKDSNHDGKIDEADGGEVMSPPPGPVAAPNSHGFTMTLSTLQSNGDIVTSQYFHDVWTIIWRLEGFDKEGLPIYRLSNCQILPRPKGSVISPYTGEVDDTLGVAGAIPTPSGGLLGVLALRSAPGGTGLFNAAGTDLAEITDRGLVRWIHPLARAKGLMGITSVGPVTMTSIGATGEFIAVNSDGLGLGGFGFPRSIHYEGFFIDAPGCLRADIGADGLPYVLVADNLSGRNHWWRLEGVDSVTTASQPVSLNEEGAKGLATLPAKRRGTAAKDPSSVVRINRLKAPLTIDGGLEKWRTAGVSPQIIITPETAQGSIDGARDLSAIVRLAYHGRDLYAQFLVFDDQVEFFQPIARHFQQDGVELCLNGFQKGFKFDVTETTDGGPTIYRQRFYFNKLDKALSPELAPRSIRVLSDARDVPERTLIESVMGEDLSASKVLVVEFKLPIDDTSYEGSTKDVIPMEPGKSFRFGILINDNDDPGTDIQHWLVWPATYGNFNPVEDGAIGVLE